MATAARFELVSVRLTDRRLGQTSRSEHVLRLWRMGDEVGSTRSGAATALRSDEWRATTPSRLRAPTVASCSSKVKSPYAVSC